MEELSRAIGRRRAASSSAGRGRRRSRGGLARLDYTQNAINKTLVAPLQRPRRAGAPVSMPITWDELDDPELRSDHWTIADAAARLDDVGDLMAGALHDPQRLPSLS